MNPYQSSDMEFSEGSFELRTTAKQSDSLYISQRNWEESKAVKIYHFFELADSLGILNRDAVFTLEDQLKVHRAHGDKVDYQYPTVLPFKREKSNGEIEQCYIIRNGHHRIWLARALGITLEVKIDNSYDLGIVNFKPTDIEVLNDHVRGKTQGNLGVGFTQIFHNNLVERSIKQFIRNLEL